MYLITVNYAIQLPSKHVLFVASLLCFLCIAVELPKRNAVPMGALSAKNVKVSPAAQHTRLLAAAMGLKDANVAGRQAMLQGGTWTPKADEYMKKYPQLLFEFDKMLSKADLALGNPLSYAVNPLEMTCPLKSCGHDGELATGTSMYLFECF